MRPEYALVAWVSGSMDARRKELTIRLRARRCEWCDTTASVEIHQVRKLADLASDGRSPDGRSS